MNKKISTRTAYGEALAEIGSDPRIFVLDAEYISGAYAVHFPGMLLVPMLIPLIPGGDLYYMMSFLVRGQYEAFGQYAQRVLTEAGAIALGIICVASLMNIIAGLRVRARGGK